MLNLSIAKQLNTNPIKHYKKRNVVTIVVSRHKKRLQHFC